MTTQYNPNKSIQGINGFGLPFCDTIYSVTLAASTDTSVTVPAQTPMGAIAANQKNKYVAVVTASAADVYMAVNATAAVPVGDTFALVSSGMLPNAQPYARYVNANDVLHFITAGADISVTVEFYAMGEPRQREGPGARVVCRLYRPEGG